MKLITRDTDYAIRAICYIAKKNKKIVSAVELVDRLKIPRPFLRKILQVLSNKRILKSAKGKGGGFSLSVAPDKAYLLNLIEIFQGRLKLNECTFKKTVCPNIKTCKLKKSIDKIQKYVIGKLKTIKISDLL
jgi:Rrf2 family protein